MQIFPYTYSAEVDDLYIYIMPIFQVNILLIHESMDKLHMIYYSEINIRTTKTKKNSHTPIKNAQDKDKIIIHNRSIIDRHSQIKDEENRRDSEEVEKEFTISCLKVI